MALDVMTVEASALSRTILALALLAATLGFGVCALAGPLDTREQGFSGPPLGGGPQVGGLRGGMFGGPRPGGRQVTAFPVARYVSEDGDLFTLDRTQPRPLLKFDNSGEVWVLQAQPAPRGDVIYKNDQGEPVLRATRLGGVTVFTDHRPDGEAAALAGAGPPLRLLLLGPQAVLERLAQASFRATRAAHHLVVFDADGGSGGPDSAALIADAALVASLAVVRCAEKPEARGFLARLRRVFLVEGRHSGLQFDQGTLKITVAPKQGLAGRPSSDRIMALAARY